MHIRKNEGRDIPYKPPYNEAQEGRDIPIKYLCLCHLCPFGVPNFRALEFEKFCEGLRGRVHGSGFKGWVRGGQGTFGVKHAWTELGFIVFCGTLFRSRGSWALDPKP